MNTASTANTAIASVPTFDIADAEPHPSPRPARHMSLNETLAERLRVAGVRYCIWKGHLRPERWLSGNSDLDLLVDRRDATAFNAVLQQLGFHRADAAPAWRVPGVTSFLAVHPVHGHLVHIHVHFQVVLGRVWATHYRPPIERSVLDSAVHTDALNTANGEWAFILFVLHQTLRHNALDAVRSTSPRWIRSAQTTLWDLEDATDQASYEHVLTRDFPSLSLATFRRCLASLQENCPRKDRVTARAALAWELRAYKQQPTATTTMRRVVDRAVRALRLPPTLVAPAGKELTTGGIVIALIGSDGAGKSTCARGLCAWLEPELQVAHAHLGRPPRGLLTFVVGAVYWLAKQLAGTRLIRPTGSLFSHAELARTVCTARDRFRLYGRVRRLAADGCIVVCERYPVPENRALAGPSTAQGIGLRASSRFATALRTYETGLYEKMAAPDVILVLQVDPETAVMRKFDEPENYVRMRARLVWNTDWSHSPAQVVDATRPLSVVLADLRARVWRAL